MTWQKGINQDSSYHWEVKYIGYLNYALQRVTVAQYVQEPERTHLTGN